LTLDQNRISEFESYVTGFRNKHQVPGLAVALADGEDVVYTRAFGYRDLARRIPATTGTIFGIASVTKSFTAMAVGKLVEEGKLQFDDRVSKYLPSFRLPGSGRTDVTVRHLLTHTSGMPALDALRVTFQAHSSRDPQDSQQEPLAEPPINTYPQLIDYIAQSPGQPLGAPGEYFNYSNEGYALLGALVRRVSGLPYAAFVRKHFLEPLRMGKTTYSFEEMYEHDEVTVLYTKQRDGSLQASTRWPCAPGFQSAGRLKSTVEDLIRPFQMYANGGALDGVRILSPEIIRQTTTPRFNYSLYESYGHALMIRPDYHGVTLVSHGGAGKGISAHAGLVPERKLSAVVLTNLGGVPVIQLWGALINLGLGLPVATPRAEYITSDWPDGTAEQLAGHFASAEGNEFVLVADEGRLLLEHHGRSDEVRRVTANVGLYDDRGHEQEIKFYRDDAGELRGVGIGVRFIPRDKAGL
jgi:CubicO group peptidase (beta-lactamase class C family)